MKPWFKRNSGFLYLAVLTLIFVLVLVNSEEFPRVLEALSTLEPIWIWATIGCMGAYLLIRAVTMWFYIRSRGCKLGFGDAMLVSGIGQFYSAVTPSASGGQPFQVVSLRQRGVPISIGTAAVSIKFIGFQLAVMLLGGLLWIAQRGRIAEQLGGARWLVVFGYLLNLAMIAVVLGTMARSAHVDRFARWLVRTGARLRLIKDEQAMAQKVIGQLDEYRDSLQALKGHARDSLIMLTLSMLQIIFLMAPVCTVYHAFHLSITDDLMLLTLQFLLFVTASFVPLPGAQEGGFFLFFRGLVPAEAMLPMMLCWRFFTYYLLLIVGMVAVFIDTLVRRFRGPTGEP